MTMNDKVNLKLKLLDSYLGKEKAEEWPRHAMKHKKKADYSDGGGGGLLFLHGIHCVPWPCDCK